VSSHSARLAEIAALLGYDAVWVDMEHAAADLRTAEELCRAAEGKGAVSLVRVAGAERDHILHALEIGAQMVLIPMVNDAATARQVVRHGKYQPLGERGFQGASRGLQWGIGEGGLAGCRERANTETHLFPQIETREACAKVEEIVAVEGISGVFVGVGDLSADLGHPGRFDTPELEELVLRVIDTAKRADLWVGMPGVPPLRAAAAEAGVDFFALGSDLVAMRKTWGEQLATYRAELA
jgi:2-keto-3-deoxy-L-rhamnonate aldolase RhmA